MPKKNLVPGVEDTAKKAARPSRAKTAKVSDGSDLRPRDNTEQPVVRGIDPAVLEQHMQAQNASDAVVLGNEVHEQVEHAMAGQMNREVIAQVLREMGMLPQPQPQPAVHNTDVTINMPSAPTPFRTEAPVMPPLVSQGLVNVLMQVRQMPTALVEAKLDDLTGILKLRESASTVEARQRYTLMACVQIVQDFEQLWATPTALQM